MIEECFSLILFIASFNVSALFLPYFSTSPNFFDMKLSNVTCTNINGSNITLNALSNWLLLDVANNVLLSCYANLDVHSYHGRLEFILNLENSNIDLALFTEDPLCVKSLNKKSKSLRDDAHITANDKPEFFNEIQDKFFSQSCSSDGSEVVNCETRVKVTHLVSVPSDKFVETILSEVKVTIEENFNKYICGVKLEETRNALKNKTTVKPLKSLSLRENATAIESVKLLRSLVNIINFLELNVNSTKIICRASLLNHTRLTIVLTNEEKLALESINYSTFINLSAQAEKYTQEQFKNGKTMVSRKREVQSLIQQLTKTLLLPFLHLFIHGSIKLLIPANSHLSLDVDFDDLQCSGEQSECSIPCESGLQFSNLRLLLQETSNKETSLSTEYIKYNRLIPNNLEKSPLISEDNKSIDDGDIYRLFTNHIAPYILNEINSELSNYFCASSNQSSHKSVIRDFDHLLQNFTEIDSVNTINTIKKFNNNDMLWEKRSKTYSAKKLSHSRYKINLPTSVEPQIIAPWWVIYFIIPASIIQCVGLTLYSIRQNRIHPILDLETNKELSLHWIILEDGALSLGVSICLIAFIWSNSTYGASVCFGQEMYIYNFSLLNTVNDLWSAGLRALAIFVLLFSGIYPYVKLYTIIVMTIILRKPESLVLKVVDLLGKFSFIDTFVMIIMVSGLEIKNVADVHILPSFYVFLLGTVGSIILGNMATCRWRNKTSLRSWNHEIIESNEQITAGNANSDATKHDISKSAILTENNLKKKTSKVCIETTNNVTHHIVEIQNSSVLSERLHEEIHQETESLLETTNVRPSIVTKLSITLLVKIKQLYNYTERMGKIELWEKLWIIITSIILLIEPCIEFEIIGLAVVITKEKKRVTFTAMSWEAGVICFIICISTVIVTPVLYVWKKENNHWLFTWCTADVFIIACVASVWQLEQFVTFVIGKQMSNVYSAKAILR